VVGVVVRCAFSPTSLQNAGQQSNAGVALVAQSTQQADDDNKDSSRAGQSGMRVTIVEVACEGAEDVTSLWCNDRGSLAKGKPPPLPLPFGEVIRSHTRANASLYRKGVAADVPLCYI
jgi:hypothetical protein